MPLTNGLVSQIFGVRHLSMLGGIVFLSHQVGSFFGAWLAGWLFEDRRLEKNPAAPTGRP